jgi:2-hydroxychromene-2-carboxylate isomerase
MGEVINLEERRAARWAREHRRAPARPEFLFDLACPFTYLAVERVERALATVTWTPASAPGLRLDGPVAEDELRRAAEARASELHLPLVWPDLRAGAVPGAMRVAHYAAEAGRGGAFALAASRLAFGGGFDLDDPEALADAAAAAGLSAEACLHAAADPDRDAPILAAGRRVIEAGAPALPALQLGPALVWGEAGIAQSLAAARLRAAEG